VTYGAKESNPTEAAGIALIVVGLVLFTVGWAYLDSALEFIFLIVGIVAFVGGFYVLHLAKEGRSLKAS
jgi:hypothetical protein